MTYTIQNDKLLLDLLFKMEEQPTLRHRYEFWQRANKIIKDQSGEAIDSSKIWNYQVNVISGEVTIHQLQEKTS